MVNENIRDVVDMIDYLIKAVLKTSCDVDEKNIIIMILKDMKKKLLTP
jgi:hypothetical protein